MRGYRSPLFYKINPSTTMKFFQSLSTFVTLATFLGKGISASPVYGSSIAARNLNNSIIDPSDNTLIIENESDIFGREVSNSETDISSSYKIIFTKSPLPPIPREVSGAEAKLDDDYKIIFVKSPLPPVPREVSDAETKLDDDYKIIFVKSPLPPVPREVADTETNLNDDYKIIFVKSPVPPVA